MKRFKIGDRVRRIGGKRVFIVTDVSIGSYGQWWKAENEKYSGWRPMQGYELVSGPSL